MSEENYKEGCLSIIAIIVCLMIALAVSGPFAADIRFLAYPLIVGSVFLLAKLTELIWCKNIENSKWVRLVLS
jgi:hypothetical protein